MALHPSISIAHCTWSCSTYQQSVWLALDTSSLQLRSGDAEIFHMKMGDVLICSPCSSALNVISALQNLVFTVALVAADASKLKLQNGVVAQKIAEAASGAGNLAQSITPGASFGPVVFYIDQSQQGLPKKATTKWGWGG